MRKSSTLKTRKNNNYGLTSSNKADFWHFLKRQISDLKNTTFSDINSANNTPEKKLNFGQKRWIIPYENVNLLALLKTSIFWSKSHSFLSRMSKHGLFWHNFCKKHTWEKVEFFDKNRGLSPYENVNFLALLKTSIFWSRNHSFVSRMSKHDLFWHNFCKKHSWEKVGFFDKNHGLTP